MNFIIVSSSLCWIVAMSIILTHTISLPVKIMCFFAMTINIIISIGHLHTNNIKRTLELRTYTDNILMLLLVIFFPKICFYGFLIQVLLGIIVNYFYLNKIRIYRTLIFLIVAELCIYISISSFKFSMEVVFNTSCIVLLLSVLWIIRNKLLVSPELKFKRIVDNTNFILRREIIETVSPMSYYIRDLNDMNKSRMESLISKLINIAQNKTNNFGHLITIIRASICYNTQTPVNITLIEQATKTINIDPYALILIMYVLFDSSVINSATEITVKYNKDEIDIIDNGQGFDLNAKENFSRTSLKTAIDLLELYNIPVKFSSAIGAGTHITLKL